MNKTKVCGYCAGDRPGEIPKDPVVTEQVSVCPCCHQYALGLYDLPCRRPVGHMIGAQR